MVHQQMIEKVLERLDEEQAGYFTGVLTALNEDPRAKGLQGMTPMPSSWHSGIISRSSSR